MEKVLARVAGLVFRHYKAIIIFFLAVGAASGFTVYNMEIDTDIIDTLPKGGKNIERFRGFLGKFGSMDSLVVVVEAKEGAIKRHIGLIEAVAARLDESPMIETVDYSPLNIKGGAFLRHFPLFLDDAGIEKLKTRLAPGGMERQIRQNRLGLFSPLNTTIDYELATADPLGLGLIVADSVKRRLGDGWFDVSEGYYMTRDGSVALLFAKPAGRTRDVAFTGALKKEVDRLVKAAFEEAGSPRGVQVKLTGSFIIAEEVHSAIRHDIISSFAVSALLIALLIWAVYRVRAVVLLMVGLTLASSLAITLAVAHLIFGNLNIVTTVVASVLIGLYVDYSMHMFKRFGDEMEGGKGPYEALGLTLARTGPALVVSSVTTAISFFSIVVTGFRGLYELGIVSGIGVVICLLCNLFLLSSLLVLASMGGAHVFRRKPGTLWAERLSDLVVSRSGRIIAVGALLLLVVGLGAFRLGFESDPEKIGLRDSPALEAMRDVRKIFGRPGDPLVVVMDVREGAGLSHAVDRFEALAEGWEKDGLISAHDSFGRLVPAFAGQQEKIRKIKDAFPEGPPRAEGLKKGLLSALERNGFLVDEGQVEKYSRMVAAGIENPSEIGLDELKEVKGMRTDSFYNMDGPSVAAYIYPGPGGWDRKGMEGLMGVVESEGWTLVGSPLIFDELKSTIIKGSILAVAITLLFNLVVIHFYVRKASLVALVMLPVTMGSVLTLGFMGLFGVPFNFINVGAVAIIFGIGVDYGIYVMQAYLKEEERDVRNALRLTFKTVSMCAVTTVAGCGSLVTVRFAGIASLGLTLSIGAVACAFSALVVLPAALHHYSGRT